ncbi:hypothetical protein D7X33_19155, partial [Butyricicoccus sp. 1XD8-22]
SVKDRAFNRTNITRVFFNEGLEVIEPFAFDNIPSDMNSLILPSSLVSVGYNAFDVDTKIPSMYILYTEGIELPDYDDGSGTIQNNDFGWALPEVNQHFYAFEDSTTYEELPKGTKIGAIVLVPDKRADISSVAIPTIASDLINYQEIPNNSTPEISVQNGVMTSAKLNGIPYEIGTPIVSTGLNVLEVYAQSSTNSDLVIKKEYVFTVTETSLTPEFIPVEVDSNVTDKVIEVNDFTVIDVATIISGDVHFYSVETDNENITANIDSDGILRIDGVTEGEANITVTVTGKDGGSVQFTFKTTVISAPAISEPVEVIQPIPDLNLTENTKIIDLSDYFSGDIADYEVSSNNTNIAVSVNSEGKLEIRGETEGTSTVTVKVTGEDGSSQTMTFDVQVQESAVSSGGGTGEDTEDGTGDGSGSEPTPTAPELDVNSSMSIYLEKEASETLNLEPLFSSSSPDNVVYEIVNQTGSSYATATIDSAILTVTGLSRGESTIQVRAQDANGNSPILTIEVKVHEENETITPPVPPSDESNVISLSIVGYDVTRQIPVSSLVTELDDSTLNIDLINSNDAVISYSYDSINKVIDITSKTGGFSNLEFVATDGNGNRSSLLALIDVSETATYGVNSIRSAEIKAGEEWYVVPLNEVFGEVVTSQDAATYYVAVQKKTDLTSPDSADVVANLELPMQPMFMMASLEPMVPMLAIASSEPSSTEFEVPAGVTNYTVYDDGTLKIQIVDHKLVATGLSASEYDISVQAENSRNEISAIVPFSLKVVGNADNSGDTGNSDNSGSDGDTGNNDNSDGDGDTGSNDGTGNGGSSGGSSSGGSSSGGTSSGGSSSTGGNSANTDSNGTTEENNNSDIEFSDVPSDSWYYDAVNEAIEKGITSGTLVDGVRYFNPNEDVTRAQATIMILRSLGIDFEGYQGNSFEDTKGKWYESAVTKARDLGIVSGYEDGEFKGNELISREHLAAILTKAYLTNVPTPNSTFSDVTSSRWTYEEIGTLADLGVVSGYEDGTFKPTENATRAHTIAMIIKLINSDSPLLDLEKFTTNNGDLVYSFVDGNTAFSTTLDVAEYPSLPLNKLN